ncbi:hypothetical protein SEUCBS140593_008550 [Sporothrix eucalyptigena]|uniref:Zinc finger PHD-type domain-containing protein n=1 Tax=Sporothrix eucalyptigena TaxID=1812306 RepID=A0ABP0CQI8_9PEZI
MIPHDIFLGLSGERPARDEPMEVDSEQQPDEQQQQRNELEQLQPVKQTKMPVLATFLPPSATEAPKSVPRSPVSTAPVRAPAQETLRMMIQDPIHSVFSEYVPTPVQAPAPSSSQVQVAVQAPTPAPSSAPSPAPAPVPAPTAALASELAAMRAPEPAAAPTPVTTAVPVQAPAPELVQVPAPAETPAPPPPKKSRYTNQFSAATHKAIIRGMNRKRTSSPAATEGRTMPMPVKKEDNGDSPLPTSLPVCSVCDRPARSILHPLVTCRRCNRRWHPRCHQPAIPDYIAATAGEVAGPATDNGKDSDSIMVDGVTGSTPAKQEPAKPTWACPPCKTAEAAAASARLANNVRTNNRPADALYVPPPPAQKTHNLAGQTPEQRRQYLATVSQRELAQWLAFAIERHPDMAAYPQKQRPPPPHAQSIPKILPPLPGTSIPGSGPRLTAAEVFAASRNPKYRNGIINSIRRSHAASVEKERVAAAERDREAGVLHPRRGRPPLQRQEDAQRARSPVQADTPVETRPPRPVDPSHIPSFVPTPVDPEEEDPTGLMAGWPKPGRGMYAKVGPDWDMDEDDEGNNLSGNVLVDRNDHTSFSGIVYNAVGQKVQENGIPVLPVR